MSTKAAKTVNNILTVLNVLLKKAVDWDVIDRMPCAVTLLPCRRRRCRSTTSTIRTTRRGDELGRCNCAPHRALGGEAAFGVAR